MSSRGARSAVSLVAVASALALVGGAGGGCTPQSEFGGDGGPPGGGSSPLTTTAYSTTAISKLDILLDIDNSQSMGDKEQYLQAAIPDLITRLTSPNCVDSGGNAIVVNGVQVVADPTTGVCSSGFAEFAPIHDLHVGVVTSSLGGRGTTSICQTAETVGAVQTDYDEFTSGSYQQFLEDSTNSDYVGLTFVSKNDDDQAHLINRTEAPSDPWAPAGQLTGTSSPGSPPGRWTRRR
jgi:hypothetical protein